MSFQYDFATYICLESGMIRNSRLKMIQMKSTRSMSFSNMKPFWILATVFGLLFAVLFSIRLDLFDKILYTPSNVSLRSINSPSERDSWKNIFQNNRKIGSSHTTLSKTKRHNRYIKKRGRRYIFTRYSRRDWGQFC